MRTATAIPAMPTTHTGPPGYRADLRKKPSASLINRRAVWARVLRVSADQIDSSSFPEYLDSLLNIAGLSNVDAQRISGTGHTIIGKWRRGVTTPTIERLRPLADALGIPRAAMFFRAGLLEPEDVNVKELLLRLSSVLEALPEPSRKTTEAHLRLILDGAQRELDELDRKAKKTG